ncbi:SIS domain-containing protein [Candidatus Woesebacteria bacterium]|jgi:phosphoheptose isomerase|nr:SIS domain-containing protein [Candidatus Woesebacteria bacterium]
MKHDMFSSSTYFDLVTKAVEAVKNSPEYSKAVTLLLDCYKQGGTVFVMGCGGSASTATHFAADLAKTTMSEGRLGFKAMALVDNIPLVSAWTNDKGWNTVFEGQLRPWITEKDVLVGFSVHGGNKRGDEAGPWSQNLVAAVALAKERNAKTIGFSGFDGGALGELTNACLTVATTDEAFGTPLVEAMHVVIFHGLVFELKEKMKALSL